jgi:hypothetical protein
MDDPTPFGIKDSRSFLVLDKSFLQGVTSALLQCYAQKGWTFGVTEVLMHEHFRKRDAKRTANIFKLHSIENRIALLPGIGEMFREEAKTLQPSSKTLRVSPLRFTPEKGPSGDYFELDGDSLRSVKQREVEYEKRCDDMIEVWRDFRLIPRLAEATAEEIPERVRELSLSIRDDREDMRAFYGNHRPPIFPAPELIDEDWTIFRWIQVQLLGGLDYYASYGVNNEPPREKLMHELLDLMYLISAVLVGGLACRERRFIERFRLLRPDGVVLM